MTTINTPNRVEHFKARLGNVVNDFGHARIPRFQRSYVWGSRERAALVDSVVDGVPIGVITMWSPRRYSDDFYVLDGQQRLTSLVGMIDSRGPWADTRGAVVDGIELPFRYLVDTSDFHEWLYEDPRMKAADRETWRHISGLHSRVRDTENTVIFIYGDYDYAKTVYTRMNSTGIPTDPDDVRPDDGAPTLAAWVASMV